MNYVILTIILMGCVIVAVVLVTPFFRFGQMQSSDLHLLAEFRELARENRQAIIESREAILDLERRLEHTDAPPKAPGVPDVSANP